MEKVVSTEELLLDWFKQQVQQYVEGVLLEGLMRHKENDVAFLETVIEQYHSFLLYSHWMRMLFNYLDRFYTKQLKTSTMQLQLSIYKQYYFDIIDQKLTRIIFKLLDDERKGDLLSSLRLVLGPCIGILS